MRKVKEGEITFFAAAKGAVVTIDVSRKSDSSRFIVELSEAKDSSHFDIRCYRNGVHLDVILEKKRKRKA